MILYLYNFNVPTTCSPVWLVPWYREFITFNAEHCQKIPAIFYHINLMTFPNNFFIPVYTCTFIYFFVQDCRVVIWTKNEVEGGSWTSKVIQLKQKCVSEKHSDDLWS